MNAPVKQFTNLEAKNEALTIKGPDLGNTIITPEMAQKYHDDGVLYIKGALSSVWLNLANIGFIRNIRNPGPYANRYFEGMPGEFYGDFCNYFANPEYQILLKHSPIADMVKAALRTDKLWLYYDQLFLKEGGQSRRTPWHQDTPYWLTTGAQLGSMWFSLDPLTKADSLEVIPGSHRSTMYNPSNFNPDDETDPKWKSTNAQRLPDIEKNRDKFNIVSWEFEPGDVLILHPGVLHGGAGTDNGRRRRTLSIRFFGDDAIYDPVPEGLPSPPFWGVSEAHKPGDPLRHEWFPLIRG